MALFVLVERARPMAFLNPHFEPDVFVSYSHGDPRGLGDSPLKHWTHVLIRRLESQILALDDEFDALKIWFDEQIDPTAHLTEELRGKACASGILMIVLSKRYLGSSWCRDELDWFRKQIQDRAIDQGRVFVVKAQPTDSAAWPDFLRDERGHAMPGFTFYDANTAMPYGWPEPRDSDRDFIKELCRLQTALTKRLRELRERAKKRAQAGDGSIRPTARPGDGSRRIYLHATEEDETARADIGRVLLENGIVPLTTRSDGTGGLLGWQRDSKTRIEAAKRCDALALLRTGEGSDRFVGDLLEIGVDERERISSARGAPLPCAVLDHTGASLPIDVSPFGIGHFDVTKDEWRGAFRQWLDAARGQAAGAAP